MKLELENIKAIVRGEIGPSLECDYAADARYHYPKRMSMILEEVEHALSNWPKIERLMGAARECDDEAIRIEERGEKAYEIPVVTLQELRDALKDLPEGTSE